MLFFLLYKTNRFQVAVRLLARVTFVCHVCWSEMFCNFREAYMGSIALDAGAATKLATEPQAKKTRVELKSVESSFVI